MSERGCRRGGKHTPAANGGKWIRPDKRLAIYLRDGLQCAYCGRCVEDGIHLQLDHYVRVQDGGTNESNNLVTCCRSCNSSKQNLTIRTWYRCLRERGIDTLKVQGRARGLMRRDLKPYRDLAKDIIAGRAPHPGKP